MNEVVAEQEVKDFLAHYGKKGMKWGVRSARKEVASVGKSARAIIKESGNATTNKERKAAADRYENEILPRLKSKEFKEAYRTANTMTKGEMAVHALVFGPFAAATIPQVRAQYTVNRSVGANRELAMGRQVLKELRQPL